jgi:hypothetical protein
VAKHWKTKDLNLEEVRDDERDELISFCVKDVKTNVVIPKLKQYLNEWKELNPGVDPSSVRHQYIVRVVQGSYSGVPHKSATLSAEPPPKKTKRVFVSVETPVSEEPSSTEEPPGSTPGFLPIESNYQTVEQLVDGSRWKALKLRALLEIMGAEALPEFVDGGIDEYDDLA